MNNAQRGRTYRAGAQGDGRSVYMGQTYTGMLHYDYYVGCLILEASKQSIVTHINKKIDLICINYYTDSPAIYVPVKSEPLGVTPMI